MVNTIMGYARDVGRTMTEWQPTKDSRITSIAIGTMMLVDFYVGYNLYRKFTAKIVSEKFFQPLYERQYKIVGITFIALTILVINFVVYKLARFIAKRFFSEIIRKQTQNQLLEDIEKEPDNAKHYYNLAGILQEDFVDLLDGTHMSKMQLLLKSIELDPDDEWPYFHLAFELPQNNNITLTLPNGEVANQKELLLKVIECNPASEGAMLAYVMLAVGASNAGNPVTLADGTVLSTQELYLKTLELSSKYDLDHRVHAVTYTLLGMNIPKGQKIQLPDGTDASCEDLYLKAIQLEPEFGGHYFHLAMSLQPGNTIKLLDGTIISQQGLFIKAISLNPTKADYYIELAQCLPMSGSVKLLDGKKYTQKQLLLEANRLDPDDLTAVQLLAAHIQAALPPAPTPTQVPTPDPNQVKKKDE